LNAPHLWAAFQGVPAELASGTDLKLAVQGGGVVVIDQLQGLAWLQGFKRAEDQRVTLGWGDLAEVKGADNGCGHGAAFKDVLLMPVYFNRENQPKQ
jgi:hypothetical protein